MLQDMISKLRAIDDTKSKYDYIKEHADDKNFVSFLYYLLNPQINYHISEDVMQELLDENEEPSNALVFFKDIFECCEYLSRLRIMDKATLRQVRSLLCSSSKEEKMLYAGLLTRTLDIGVTSDMVNQIIHGLIPVTHT